MDGKISVFSPSVLKLAAFYFIVSVISGRYGIFACFLLCVPPLFAGVREKCAFTEFLFRIISAFFLGIGVLPIYMLLSPPFSFDFIAQKLIFVLILAFFCYYFQKSENRKSAEIFKYFSLFAVNFICFL